jgi:hypothetical protein
VSAGRKERVGLEIRLGRSSVGQVVHRLAGRAVTSASAEGRVVAALRRSGYTARQEGEVGNGKVCAEGRSCAHVCHKRVESCTSR